MDVNANDWSQKKFIDAAEFCQSKRNGKRNGMCRKTDYACKDYLCPYVKSSKTFEEVQRKIEE
jgi:hypothetical protein